MKVQKDIIVIVDAYTTGKYLAPGFLANGYPCVHLQSRKNVIPAYLSTFNPGNFIEAFIYDSCLDTVVDALKPYNVIAVIPGAETGVMLADSLNSALGLPNANPLQKSEYRRNKYLMQELLRKKSLASVPQQLCHSIEMLLAWADKNSYPYVVKPIDSSGSQGVRCCEDEEALKVAWGDILQMKTVFGDKIDAVLIQEQMIGQEFVVNTVSCQGEYRVTDVWVKYKSYRDGVPINEYSDLLGKNDPRFYQIVDYVYRVLDALDIKYGAAHAEVILTDDGPVLVEVAARLAGSIDPSAVNKAMGHSQVSQLIDSYLRPNTFLKCSHYPESTRKLRHVFLRSSVSGKIYKEADLSSWMQLKSLHSLAFHYQRDMILATTTTLADFPGYLYLINDKQVSLLEDYRAIRSSENDIYAQMISSK